MKSQDSTIQAFLYTPNANFDIPDFQRPYSWSAENIESFLRDLENAKGGDRNHYFGNVVYIDSGNINEKKIIDGQQRTTTVLLMMTAIYHVVLANEEKSEMPADQINKSYLSNEFGDEDKRIKLRTVTSDNQIYRKIYESNGNAEKLTLTERESRLYKAYKTFLDYFSGKENIHEYIGALDRFQIVEVKLDERDDNPQKVFESINSTGKPLTDGDKIRNFSLMLNDDDIRKIVFEEYWQKIEKNLTDVNQDYISDFFKAYITVERERDVVIRDVYKEFKDIFAEKIGDDHSNEKSVRKFYDGIIDHLESYLFLKFLKDENAKFTGYAEAAFRLHYLGVEVSYPFLMRALGLWKKEKIAGDEVAEIFYIIESYLSRRLVVRLNTTGLAKMFASLHRDIIGYGKKDDGGHAYVDHLKYVLIHKRLNLRFPTGQELEAAIESNPIYQQRIANVNYILSSVEDAHQKNESELLKGFAQKKTNFSVEHIMPQTLTQEWREHLGERHDEIHDAYLHTLANLTLTGYNAKYSNRKFEDKKTMKNGFDSSPLHINQYIKNVEEWNEEALNERASWWKREISDLWVYPETKFVPVEVSEAISIDDALEGSLKGRKLRKVWLFGDVFEHSNWTSAYEGIILVFLEKYGAENFLHNEKYERYISDTQENLRRPSEIEDTGIYVETNLNTEEKVNFLKGLVDDFDLGSESIKFEYV